MKAYIHSLFFLLISLTGYAQNQQTNLEKYWRYRDRLRNNFVVVSPNVEMPGVNIPISQFWRHSPSSLVECNNFIGTGDFNVELQHYISMLATEYKLLNSNGQDCNQTLCELIYALIAFERLDAYTESQYKKLTSPDGTWSFDERDINGFFLRGDLSANFFNQYSDHFFNFDFKYFNSIGNYVGQIPMDPIEGRYNFNSNFESGAERNADVEPIICRVKWDNGNCKISQAEHLPFQTTQGYKCMSIDNMIHMMFAATLVKSLLNDNIDISNVPINWMKPSSGIKSYLEKKGILNASAINFKIWADDIARRMYDFLISNANKNQPNTIDANLNKIARFYFEYYNKSYEEQTFVQSDLADIINPITGKQVSYSTPHS